MLRFDAVAEVIWWGGAGLGLCKPKDEGNRGRTAGLVYVGVVVLELLGLVGEV